MGSEWEQVLKAVISEVLETMFFAVVDFEHSGPGDHTFDFESEILLSSSEGKIVISLQVGEEFARMTTADFLGIGQDQVKEDDIEDTMKELANMIGGLYHAGIDDFKWELGIPRVWKIDQGVSDRSESFAGLNFSFFGQPAGSVRLVRLQA
jgi:hypothetical protein